MENIISIIVPIYNAEKTLRRCIESIINQTYNFLDIILINDGSKDNSGIICDEYAQKDKRIKVIHKKNEGVSIARNCGLEQSIGNYIMFVDADDYLDIKICDVLLKFLLKNSCDITIANKVFYKNGKIIDNVLYNEKEIVRDNDEKELFILDLLTYHYDDKMNKVQFLSCGVTAKLFKTKIIKRNNLRFVENCRYGEDVIFNLYAFQYANKIGYIDFNGYNFNINSDSSTHKFRDDWKDSHEIFVNEIGKFLNKYNKDYRFYEAYEMMIATRICGLINSYYFHKNSQRKFLHSYKGFKKFIHEDKYRRSIKNVKLELLTKKQKIVILALRLHLSLPFTYVCYKKNKKKE